MSLPVWPPVEPLCGRGLIRQVPEDFVVEERVDIELEGEGEHLWVQLRKRGQNTEYVAAQLARLCEVPRRAVGYAGRKDRHAVTTQWFSVHLPGKQGPGDWTALPESVEVLQTARHRRKLQTGALKANRFRLVIRDLTGEPDQIESRLERLARRGVPNYFGEQRFGHGGRNVERAHEWFAGEFRPRDRSLRSLLLSSARSFLFNEVLAARVRADSWDRVLPGEVLILDGRRSFFTVDDMDEARARLAACDVHPSGPLWGRGDTPAREEVAALETRVIEAHPALARGLEAQRVDMGRRALRVLPRDLEWSFPEPGVLALAFELNAGSYATALLSELLDYETGAGGPPED